jgi:multiple sugar transport system ATP-binding protein
VGLSEHLGSDTFLKVNTDQVGTVTVRAGGEVMLRHGDRIEMRPQLVKLHRFGADGKVMP